MHKRLAFVAALKLLTKKGEESLNLYSCLITYFVTFVYSKTKKMNKTQFDRNLYIIS